MFILVPISSHDPPTSTRLSLDLQLKFNTKGLANIIVEYKWIQYILQELSLRLTQSLLLL